MHASPHTSVTDDSRRPGRRTSPNRPIEKAGIRAVAAIFEDAGMVVQPVDGGNDIGKDLYVDLADRDRVFTGDLIALQVKSGLSYRQGSGYRIPCSRDLLALWAGSSVPIFGMVYDPERDSICWLNLTGWARGQSADDPPAAAVVRSTWPLNERTLRDFIDEAHIFLAASGPPALLGLVDSDPRRQRAAINDAFALGRRDPRAFVLLRSALRYLREPEVQRPAIHLLALAIGGHMDIFWTPRNWFDHDVRAYVRDHLDWTHEELCQLLAAPEFEEWDRGGLGQDVAALVFAKWDQRTERALERVVLGANEEAAWPALFLLVTASDRDQLQTLNDLAAQADNLIALGIIDRLRTAVAEQGSITMW